MHSLLMTQHLVDDARMHGRVGGFSDDQYENSIGKLQVLVKSNTNIFSQIRKESIMSFLPCKVLFYIKNAQQMCYGVSIFFFSLQDYFMGSQVRHHLHHHLYTLSN